MKRVIYQPQGRAAEYATHALNLFNGCSHGCLYCYAPAVARRDAEDFHANVTVRKNVLRDLEAQVQVPGLEGEEVFLCFTCDPYQPIREATRTTREAIHILHAAKIGVNVLTKGGSISESDFDLFKVKPHLSRYGATLTFLDFDLSAQWEPRAASPLARLIALENAHRLGIPTWASIEPVIDPAQSLAIIEQALPFVDHFKLGAWNYDSRAKLIDWPRYAKAAIALLKAHNKPYTLKQDLRIRARIDKGGDR